MQITQLTIEGFRGFREKKEILFPKDGSPLVIVSANGAGKTSILEAIRIPLAIIADKQYDRHRQSDRRVIGQRDLNRKSSTLKIEAFFKNKEGLSFSYTITYDHKNGIKTEINPKRSRTPAIQPLVYFSTDRIFRETPAKNYINQGAKNALVDGLNEPTNFSLFYSWISQSKKSIQEFPQDSRNKLSTVNQAIKKLFCRNDYEIFIRNDEDSSDLFFRKGDDEFSIFQLSAGEKNIVSIASDLAMRLFMAYPNSNAPLNEKGIVLIDELELHLHPKWQEQLLNQLKETFPGIQFILTTHSPIIIRSLESESLLNLDSESVIGLEEDPFRYSVEEVLSREMGVKDVQRSQQFKEMEAAATAFFKLAQQKDNPEAIAEAKKKYQELSKQYSKDPAYVALLAAKLNL